MKNSDVDIILELVSNLKQKHNLHVKPLRGETKCPICNNELKYAINANGHIHGKCKAIDCFYFNE